VLACEAQLADVGQIGATKQQEPVPHGRVAAADDENFGVQVKPGADSHVVPGADQGEVSCALPFEDTELVVYVLLE
jgi:hypothetical protein